MGYQGTAATTVKGVWAFNDSQGLDAAIDETVNFRTYLGHYTRMYIGLGSVDLPALAYVGTSGVIEFVYEFGHWVDNAHRTVDFGETEQAVSDEFYTWLIANAIQLTSEEELPEQTAVVTITYKDKDKPLETLNGGEYVILHTSGKIMEDDIRVDVAEVGGSSEPVLQEKTITENGEFIPNYGYDGFSKVIVNVPSPTAYWGEYTDL